ncbi:MAG: S-methyl-5-thioribose-1-phosphate isomerase [Magnetococcales bacterium]|nr:S-methyl-5-thioribose-1-phosphate isomerase [Magnetococcales bacterium]MBF0151032.1 S-methyl-5-thioribose-1-phosphate isomerase [Magnetococcales bacterium]MBF0173722.1 S-methyl-5-thioribose-1-phosphate isomerase [Magnetococcales bacterium]MBF0348897.1 S-methyl-5-thioribose-1-phosphate isomerase [Magnetococcales bacterium]
MNTFEVAVWADGHLRMLDQRVLPHEEVSIDFFSAEETARGIRDMVVRGAPAIGCATAFGVAVEAFRIAAQGIPASWPDAMAPGLKALEESRPTAVNLRWSLERMRPLLVSTAPREVPQRLLAEAQAILREDHEACLQMGRHGAVVLPDTGNRPLTIMTHCNAGALATGGVYGTALGVIRGAVDAGRKVRVISCETRPFLQGARLTAWELLKDGIDTTLITDNMAAHLMSQGLIDVVVVGSDRVAANGDAANKIGTLGHAICAQRYRIPFMVAAPLSTIDMKAPDGSHIPIEERPETEVTHIGGKRIAALNVTVRNPAFDVTPAELISWFVSEKGAMERPSLEKMRSLFHG